MKLVLLGPQGSGKGTQGRRLGKELGVPHISTGDMLRDIAHHDTPLGHKIKRIIDEGHLIEDETLMEIVKNRIEQDDCKDGWILDGTPRRMRQVELLSEMTEIDHAILIEISEEETFKRLKRRAEIEHRADDNEESIRERLRIYHELTEPILGYYDARKKLIRIDGEQNIDAVYAEIKEKLGI